MHKEVDEYLCKVYLPLFDPESIDDESLPLWVRNAINHFHGTGVKLLLDVIRKKDFGPYEIGLLAGSAKHIDEILESLPKIKQEYLDKLKGTKVGKKFDQIEHKLAEIKILIDGYERDISKDSNHEESKYLKGKSEGLQLIKDEEDQIKGARENTKLLALMYFVWPVVEENCKTRRELYEFLLKSTWKSSEPEEKFNILTVEADPPSVVGSYERVEKVLRRIGFNPAKAGRPSIITK